MMTFLRFACAAIAALSLGAGATIEAQALDFPSRCGRESGWNLGDALSEHMKLSS
ncbi:hypothetical protein D3C76_1807690 [compost metagenome]